jgi:hypothetical protein
MLDGASFSRFVPLDTTAVYAAEFRRRDNTFVTCLWTVRGKRPLALQVPGATTVKLTDLMGRESDVAVKGGEAAVEVSDRPRWLSTPQAIGAVKLGEPVHDTRPGEKAFVISRLDRLEGWKVQGGRDAELETYNFMSPRRLGDFEYRTVTDEGGRAVLAVRPKLPAAGSEYLQMYSSLALEQPVEIKGEPTQIGVLVKGNGGWGRVIFELQYEPVEKVFAGE